MDLHFKFIIFVLPLFILNQGFFPKKRWTIHSGTYLTYECSEEIKDVRKTKNTYISQI